MTIIFLAMLAALFLTWFIKYPDTIKLRVRIDRTSSYIGKAKFNSFNDIHFSGEGFVDEDAFRKICVGQDVVISFIGYPHRQYGNLEGKVKSLTEIPTKDRYLVKIDLPFGLKTSKKRNIKYDIGMIGNAEIVLQNQRLIEKVLRRVK